MPEPQPWIFEMFAQGVTLKDAAVEFAKRYWDKPRKIDAFNSNPGGENATFTVTDGVRTYQVYYVKAHFPTPAVYRVRVFRMNGA